MKKNRFYRGHNKKKKKIDTFAVDKEDTLLVWLQTNLPHKSRKVLKAVLRDGQVAIDGDVVRQFDHKLCSGQRVDVSWEKPTLQQPQGVNIVYEDLDLVIINKPAGLLTVATEKEKRKTAYAILSSYVKLANPENKIFIIHRLDRETSGLLMFAKNEKIKHQIQETWTSTIEQRTYVGIVEGDVQPRQGTIVSWLKESKQFIVYSSQNRQQGKRAVTHYQTIKSDNKYSLLEIHLETGRKHQIRVHMQDIKHPIIGDKKYGSTANPIRRIGLHAKALSFTHPVTGKSYNFETEIPRKFLQLFE